MITMKTNSMPGIVAITLGLTLLTAASAPAATVIAAENFGGLSGDNLNGTSADTFAAGITTAGGSSNWVAKITDFRADGSVVGTGTSTGARAGSAYLNLGTYINDARGTANGIFVLSATISQPTTGAWLALGFSTSTAPSTSGNFTTSSTGRASMVFRVGGDIDQWRGPGSSNPVAADDITFTGSRTLTITLDFSPAAYNGITTFGTAKFGANVGVGDAYQEFGSSGFSSLSEATIGSLMLGWAGTGASANGSYSSLTLTQVPEPRAALLGGLGLLALLRRRR